MSNTITAYFKGRVGVAESVYQNDYGIVMAFSGIELPAHFDCYFSRLNQEEALPGVGADNRVTIPNSILANPGNVTIHIPLHTGEDDSEVEYVVYFKVIGRARPIDDGAPAQMTAIERAIALLTQPITNIEEIVNEALSFTGDTFNEMKAILNIWKSGVESDFDNLDSQFQTAIAAVTVDDELLNVRVGDDGVTYTSAGKAVRTQFSNVKSRISHNEDSLFSNYTENQIVSFYSGLESILREIHFLPAQEGEGVPSSENIRPFKQVESAYVYGTGQNLFPDVHSVTNDAGITMTKLANGGFKFVGTATGEYYHDFCLARDTSDNIIFPPGEYTFAHNGSIPNHVAIVLNGDIELNDNNRERHVVLSDYTEMSAYIYIAVGTTVDFVVYPYITIGGDKDIDNTMVLSKEEISLTNQYYGCTVNLKTGEVCDNYGYIESYDGEELSTYWFSDRDVYAPDTTPTTGAEVVYLKEPVLTEVIDPVNCTVIKGWNNVWCSVSALGAEYELLPSLYVQERTKAITPEMFGAIGDGINDDWLAIQACIDFAIKYKLDVLLNNNYFITKPIAISNVKGLNIYGRAMYGYFEDFVNSQIRIDNTFTEGAAIFELSNAQHVKFDGISLKGFSRTTRYGIHAIIGCEIIEITNCNISGFQKGIYSYYGTYYYVAKNNISNCTTGIEFVGCGDSTLSNNYINTNIDSNDAEDLRSGTGILMLAGSSNNKIIGGKIEWNTKGVVVSGCEGIIIADVNFDFNPQGAIRISGSSYSAYQSEGIVITGCQFRAGGVWGSHKAQILLDPTVKHIHASITGNTFQKEKGNSTTETAIGPETILKTIGGGNPIALVFTGNNMTEGATTYDLVLEADDETIAYSGNLSTMQRLITGDNIHIIE